jgi:hypothetical protein
MSKDAYAKRVYAAEDTVLHRSGLLSALRTPDSMLAFSRLIQQTTFWGKYARGQKVNLDFAYPHPGAVCFYTHETGVCVIGFQAKSRRLGVLVHEMAHALSFAIHRKATRGATPRTDDHGPHWRRAYVELMAVVDPNAAQDLRRAFNKAGLACRSTL